MTYKIIGYIVPGNFKGSVLSALCVSEGGIEFVAYSDLSKDDFLEKHKDQGAYILSVKDFEKLNYDYLYSLISDAQEISEDRYFDLLECLPPSRHHRCEGVTMFHLCEALIGNIVQWCACYSGKYFSFNDTDNRESEVLANKVKNAYSEI